MCVSVCVHVCINGIELCVSVNVLVVVALHGTQNALQTAQ